MIEYTWLLDKLWVLLGALYWWDKRKTERRIDRIELQNATIHTDNQLVNQKIDSMQVLFETKIQGVKDDTAEIKRMLNARRTE